MGKYSCLKTGNNVEVSITPGSDEDIDKWLERIEEHKKKQKL